MLEELGVPYVVRAVNIGRGDQFKPSFLRISPNNRMPAIVDPEGPGGKKISVFESGAILQYLGRKFGRFYPQDERGRAKVDEWLFWQMGGLGPMAGQTHHFRGYAKNILGEPLERIEYGINRYTNEVNRLYGVLNKALRKHKFVAGEYSIADMSIWPWVVPWKNQGQNLDDFPNLRQWFERMRKREAVQAGFAVGKELRQQPEQLSAAQKKKLAKMLYGQTAKSVVK